MGSQGTWKPLEVALRRVDLDGYALANHNNQLIRSIFRQIQALEEAMIDVVESWIGYWLIPLNTRPVAGESFHSAGWIKTYIEIERILVALLNYHGITIHRTGGWNKHHSYHVDVLKELTRMGGPLRELMVKEWSLSPENQVAIGIKSETVSVYLLLDKARLFRNWFTHERVKGAPKPELDALKICVERWESETTTKPQHQATNPTADKGRASSTREPSVSVPDQPLPVRPHEPVTMPSRPAQTSPSGESSTLSSLQSALQTTIDRLSSYTLENNDRIAGLERAIADLRDELKRKSAQHNEVLTENKELRRELDDLKRRSR